jgi:hypothetical protein
MDFTSLQGLWNVPDVLFGRLIKQLAHPSTGNVNYDTTAKVSMHTLAYSEYLLSTMIKHEVQCIVISVSWRLAL